MFKKVCHRCDKASYSLSAKGRWICPGCGTDLTDRPVRARGSGIANVLPVTSSELKGPDLN